ncbi:MULTISPECIES: carboxylate-amine ligase [Salegentibacter]|jgi:carboxylate-amine ligase|uniref:Carboxylate-amine ligase n=2 Tax=Salegentibacter TaxID=143222 RepID=A0A1I2N4F4_9FLAO|nr:MULTISPECIES: glutamate-cysteine ligase family protein [Salegentibacter]APS39731.1 glutamate--cysteine ligase [Salegentibacter sp. T436]SFF97980.1 carboxylate-amine ligase [Salegentibacter agarivorans]
MKYHLFEVFGIELEYMLVDTSSFKVNPIVDQLFISKNGEITSDIENGEIEWSNELVAHVVELKTNGPTGDIENLDLLFAENIKEVNLLLKEKNTRLLPSAAHPLMNPVTETELWKHSSSKIYALYNRIFDCSGHGWSNVQSMHINLPFFDDTEFEKLHAAVRLLLPIIPALSASSPIFEGKDTGFKDARMQVYKTNQKEIPEMTGKVIPEQVFSKDDYYKTIFEPINKKIKPHDTENILDHHFLNSRGAIARFDRNAIEIRVIDVQECPKADMAIAIFIIECLKLLVSEDLIAISKQKKWHENDLFEIFDAVIKDAENTKISNKEYLKIFGLSQTIEIKEIWRILFSKVKRNIAEKQQESIKFLLNNGSLSTRILKALGDDFSDENIQKTYFKLADCLEENKFFKP